MQEVIRGTWTLPGITYAIKNNLEAGLKGTANFPFSIEQLEAEVIAERNAVVEQLKQSNLLGASELFQEINCVSLDCEDFGLCCETSTKQPTLHFKVPVFVIQNYTGLATQTKPFYIYEVGNTNYLYQDYKSSYTSRKPYVVYRLYNGEMHGFIFNPPTPNLKKISVRAIFENPLAVNGFKCCSYNVETDRFPAPNFVIQQIIVNITNRWASWYYRFQGQKPNSQTPQV